MAKKSIVVPRQISSEGLQTPNVADSSDTTFTAKPGSIRWNLKDQVMENSNGVKWSAMTGSAPPIASGISVTHNPKVNNNSILAITLSNVPPNITGYSISINGGAATLLSGNPLYVPISGNTGDTPSIAITPIGDVPYNPITTTVTIDPSAGISSSISIDGPSFVHVGDTITFSITGSIPDIVRYDVDYQNGIHSSIVGDTYTSPIVTALPPSSIQITFTPISGSGITYNAITKTAIIRVALPATPTAQLDSLSGINRIHVTGTAYNTDRVKVVFPNGNTYTVFPDVATHTWEMTSINDQPTGDVTVYAENAGGRSPDLIKTWVAKTKPAQVTGVSIYSTSTNTAMVSGNTELGATVTIRFPNGETKSAVSTTGTFLIGSDTIQPSGSVTITASNPLGDSPPKVGTFTAIAAPPKPTNLQSINDGTNIFSITGSARPNTTVRVTFPDGSVKTTTSRAGGAWGPVTSTVAQLTGIVQAVAVDAVGTSPVTTLSITAIPKPNAPYNGSTARGNPNIRHTVVSGKAKKGIQVKITFTDGAIKTVNANNTDGGFTATFTNINAPSGIVNIVAVNAIGTSLPLLLSFTKVPEKPDTPHNIVLTNNGGNVVTVTGKTSPNALVVIVPPDGITKTTTANALGDFTYITNEQVSGNFVLNASNAGGSSTSVTVPFLYIPITDTVLWSGSIDSIHVPPDPAIRVVIHLSESWKAFKKIRLVQSNSNGGSVIANITRTVGTDIAVGDSITINPPSSDPMYWQIQSDILMAIDYRNINNGVLVGSLVSQVMGLI